MTRVIADCRTTPSDSNCSLIITGEEAEVLVVAIRHAVVEHSHDDTPELRGEIQQSLVPES